jgi:selenocysteine lyase/cysteine desulfurase
MMNGSLEMNFKPFRDNTIGRGKSFLFPTGEREIVYADWTASGRGYRPIETTLLEAVIPFFANTHTESTSTGRLMTTAYEKAKCIIKRHVNADDKDALIFCGSGMTAAVNKLQRLLGLRIAERCVEYTLQNKGLEISDPLRPVVFVSTMEHHSNHVSWLETIAKVEIIDQNAAGNVDLEHLDRLLVQYRSHKNKIAAVTACSNVTGMQTPYHAIAKLMHAHGGLCFVDFASAAPYVAIDMHPDADSSLDAIYFSMHKFLGGPGTPGVLIFNSRLYSNAVPDHPGGGTVLYSNPWKTRKYVGDIESREDGGTPPVLQGIKAAMCVRLKEEMGVENMSRREEELLQIAWSRFDNMPNVTVLQQNERARLGIISFIVKGAHYNLIVKLLNDRFGIQLRGGCSCAGTYGHFLLNVDQVRSYRIWNAIYAGDLSSKPGWIRLSLHPTMTDGELKYIMEAIELTATHFRTWMKDYQFDRTSNEYSLKQPANVEHNRVDEWFKINLRRTPDTFPVLRAPSYHLQNDVANDLQ